MTREQRMDSQRCHNETQRNHLRYIEEEGVSILSVAPLADSSDVTRWTYTIGFWQQYRHPEVIIFGLGPRLGASLLNHINEILKAGGRRFDGGTSADDILEGFKCYFEAIPADRYGEYLLGNSWFYGDNEFPAVQMIWPTPSQVYPWAAEADVCLSRDQPIISALPTIQNVI